MIIVNILRSNERAWSASGEQWFSNGLFIWLNKHGFEASLGFVPRPGHYVWEEHGPNLISKEAYVGFHDLDAKLAMEFKLTWG